MNRKKLDILTSLVLVLATFVIVLYSQIFPEKVTVAIQPLETDNIELISNTADAINDYYGYEVVILPNMDLPENAFIELKSPRYRADTIIQYLADNRSAQYDYIIGVTETDISFTKRNTDGSIKAPVSRYADFGIFGLGFRPGNSCVVSGYRLKTKNKDQYYSRVRKVALHELGHNLGLEHCDIEGCVMNSAKEKMETIDNAYESLCKVCQYKLR